MNKREKGREYEEKAMDFFRKNGFNIIDKNYTTKIGEIDFIAEKNGKIIFVEVKYRKNNNFGLGSEAINKDKILKIYKTSQKYLQDKNMKTQNIGYDLIMFTGDQLNWIQDIIRGDEIGY